MCRFGSVYRRFLYVGSPLFRCNVVIEWANALVPPTPFQGRPLLASASAMDGKVAAQQPVEKLNVAGNGRAIPAALLRWSDGRVVILNWRINLHTVMGVLRTVRRGQRNNCDSSKLWHLLFTNTRKRSTLASFMETDGNCLFLLSHQQLLSLQFDLSRSVGS